MWSNFSSNEIYLYLHIAHTSHIIFHSNTNKILNKIFAKFFPTIFFLFEPKTVENVKINFDKCISSQFSGCNFQRFLCIRKLTNILQMFALILVFAFVEWIEKLQCLRSPHFVYVVCLTSMVGRHCRSCFKFQDNKLLRTISKCLWLETM